MKKKHKPLSSQGDVKRSSSRQRKAKKRQENARAFVREMVQAHGLASFSDDGTVAPFDNINAAVYGSKLSEVSSAIRAKFKSGNGRRSAQYELSDVCSSVIVANKLDATPPESPRRIERPPTIITQKYWLDGIACSDWAGRLEAVCERLSARKHDQEPMEADCLAGLTLASAMLNGLLCDPIWLKALYDKLMSGRRCFVTSFSSRPAIDLMVAVRKGLANWTSDAQSQRFIRWTPDPITLGLAIQTLEASQLIGKNSSPPKPVSQKETSRWVFDKISDSLWPKSSPAATVTNLTELAKGAYFAHAKRRGGSLSPALGEAVLGRHVNMPLDPVGSAALTGLSFAQAYSPSRTVPLPPRKFENNDVDVTPEVNWRRTSKPKPELLQTLRALFSLQAHRDTDHAYIRRVSAMLEALVIEDGEATPEWLYVHWLHHLQAERGLRVSSIRTYFGKTASLWFRHLGAINLAGLDSDELLSAYRAMLEEAVSPHHRHEMAGILSDIQAYGERAENFALPALAQSIMEGIEPLNYVRSRIIDWRGIQATRQVLTSDPDIDADPFMRETLSLLVLVAWRTGLRLGELVKLRLMDVEEGPEWWLFTRENQFGANKSPAGLRKIPLAALLSADEIEAFRRYYVLRRGQMRHQISAPLFSGDAAKGVLDKNITSQTVNWAFAKALGSYGWTFHHLRHSAFNIVLCAIEGEYDLAAKLGGHSEESARRIRAALVNVSGEKRNAYWALAIFAGHSNPKQTLHAYIHLVSELVSAKLARLPLIWSQDALHGACRVPRTRVIAANDGVQLLAALETKCSKWMQLGDNKTGHLPANELAKAFKNAPGTLTVKDCHYVLQRFADKWTLEQVQDARGLPMEIVEAWQTSGMDMTRLRTRRENSRSAIYNPKAEALSFLPRLPTGHEDIKLADKLVEYLMPLIESDRASVVAWCKAALNGAVLSNAGILFKAPDKLSHFLALTAPILPTRNWTIELEVRQVPEVNNIVNTWRAAVGNTCKITVTYIPVVRQLSGLRLGSVTARYRIPKGQIDANSITLEAAVALRAVPHLMAVFMGLRTDKNGTLYDPIPN